MKKKIKNNLKIGWLSHHIEGYKPLKTVISAGYEIYAIITLKDELLAKRSGITYYSKISAEYNIKIFYVDNINSTKSLEILKSLNLDILLVIGWSQILSNTVLRSVKLGCYGAHASLLPENRGCAPINWSLINGDTMTGNTLMKLSDGVDTGDIVGQKKIPITMFDNVSTLYERVADTNCDMILELLNKFSNNQNIKAKKQIVDGLPILPRRRPNDGLINWRLSAKRIYNFIRALTHPYPGAFTYENARKLYVWRSSLLPFNQNFDDPGVVIGPMYSDSIDCSGILVACFGGAILVLEIEDSCGQIYTGETLINAGFKRFNNPIHNQNI